MAFSTQQLASRQAPAGDKPTVRGEIITLPDGRRALVLPNVIAAESLRETTTGKPMACIVFSAGQVPIADFTVRDEQGEVTLSTGRTLCVNLTLA